MYAILVKEPGAETESFILSTGASTSESAMKLMSSRAEEYVDEQLEQSPTEDYTITPNPESLEVVVCFVSKTYGPTTSMVLTAVAIDEVV
ncbi:hypothetical protein D3C75_530690 [compost metagenome]